MIALNNERMVRHAPDSRQPKKEGEIKKEVVITVWDYNIIGLLFLFLLFVLFFLSFSSSLDEDDFLGCINLPLSSLMSKGLFFFL